MKQERPIGKDKGPKLPEKPKFRSLTSTAKAVRIIPYLLDGDESLGLDHEDNFVVALGPLKYRSYSNYENMFDETLDNAVSKVLYVISVVYANTNAEEGTEPPTLDRDDLNRIKTPYGLLTGSLERNMTELAAYILSQYGRIVEEHGDGTYEYDPITIDDVIDHLDARSITKVDDIDGQSLFFEILEVSGVWQPNKVEDDLKANDEVKEDELKNSTSTSTVSKSSRSKKQVDVEETQ